MTLTPGQMKAIGALSLDGGGSCTATLVAPRAVLTAAHCVENVTSSVRFMIGENYIFPERTFNAIAWHMHPSFMGTSGGLGRPEYDVAVVLLGEDATAYGIEPIPINLDRMGLAGQTIQAVGYGMTSGSGGWNTRRYWTTMPVVMDSGFYYTVDGEGVTGICSGDSGGPMLYEIPGREVRVMGVVSGGDSTDCMGLTYYPRTDAYSDFFLLYIDMGPCGYETFEGRCDGTTAVWCEADLVYTHPCADFGYVCGNDGAGLMRCVPPPPPCGDETLAGRCEGETAIWCEADTVLYHDCASFGWFCGRDPAGFYRCVDSPCRGETWEGRCSGTTAVWCEGGAALYHACADFGWECGANDDGLFRCNPPGTVTECDRIGFPGECVDAGGGAMHARWCDGGAIRDRDCAACGQSCGWTGAELGYYCL